jgi:hypothetical protein
MVFEAVASNPMKKGRDVQSLFRRSFFVCWFVLERRAERTSLDLQFFELFSISLMIRSQLRSGSG